METLILSNCGAETHQKGALIPSHCRYFSPEAPFLIQTFIRGGLGLPDSRLLCGHVLFITASASRHHCPSAGCFARGDLDGLQCEAPSHGDVN